MERGSSAIYRTLNRERLGSNPPCAYYTPYDGQPGMSLFDVL